MDLNKRFLIPIPQPFDEIDPKGLMKVNEMFAGLGIQARWHAKFGIKTVFLEYTGVYRLYAVGADGRVWARKEYIPSYAVEGAKVLAKYAANPIGIPGDYQIYLAGQVNK